MSKKKIKVLQSDSVSQLIRNNPILPLQKEKDVRNNYGVRPSLEVVPPFNPKPVDEAITDAGKYIIKMQKKGYVKLQEEAQNPHQIYQSSLIKYKKLKKESEENIQQEKKPKKALESYQTFWQTTDIVKKTVKELNELRFENNFEHYEVESRFRDQVASFVRIMNNDGMLEQKNKTKAELSKIMLLFLSKVKDIRKNLIQNYLSKGILLYSKLNANQQKEFIKFKPLKQENNDQNQDTNDEKLDSNFLNRIKQTSADFPKAYQITGLGFDGFSPDNERVKLQKELKQLAVSMHSAVDKPPAPILPNSSRKTEKNTPRDDQSIPRKRVNIIMMPKINRKGSQSALSKSTLPKPPNYSSENQNNLSTKTVLPSLTPNDVYSTYWDIQDPLAEARQGFAPNALKMIEELGQRSNKDYLKQFPTTDFANQLNKQNESNQIESENESNQIESENESNQIESENESISTQNNSDDIYQDDDNYNGPIQLDHIQNSKKRKKRIMAGDQISLRDNIFSTSITNLRLSDDEILQNSSATQRPNYLFDSKSDDIQFLIRQTSDLENGDMSQAIYKRLELIWQNLGFSVTQKLQMVIKYSESTEESSKLNSALKFWEEANSSAMNYQKAYAAYKDFLKYSFTDKGAEHISVSDLNNNLIESEKNLLQVAKSLKSMFGDDLVFRGKKVDDVIKSRRMKLKLLQGKVQSKDDQDE
ncbi:hypothetical protein M9Y10_039066 [Tritrichomonas musculus]|uniref:Uncharacterized protein n=1 Tax=Tritrichomonas musculus TaxID=1915356 RepID=A0ABR2KB71_9EUKA